MKILKYCPLSHMSDPLKPINKLANRRMNQAMHKSKRNKLKAKLNAHQCTQIDTNNQRDYKQMVHAPETYHAVMHQAYV